MNPIPDGTDALLERLRARPSLSGVQVIDGPSPERLRKQFIALGVTPEDLSQFSTREPAGPASTMQVGDLLCLVHVESGDMQISANRRRAFELLDEVIAEIEIDRSLGGAVGTTEVIGSTYAPGTDKKVGAWADVVFTVRFRAF